MVKNYKTIVNLVVALNNFNWIPTQQLTAILTTQPENVPIAIVFIEAVVASFNDRPSTPKDKLDKFLKEILPLLHQVMTGPLKTLSIIYLTVKVV